MKTLSKKLLFPVLMLLLASTAVPAIAAPPGGSATATITLLNQPPTSLAVGQSYTLRILVESDQPFNLAGVQGDIQFPAYVHDNGGDRKQNGTSAVLELILTGVRSTADLPGGVTPVTAAVGVRYPGGQLVVQSFPFEVAVP